MLSLVLKTVAIIFFLIRIVYWYSTEKIADKEKPKNQEKPALISIMSEYINWAIQIFVIVQIATLKIFPISFYSLQIQLIGLVVMAGGLAVCVSARKELSTNWTNGYEYQIKEHHELITSGIYGIIRHPIYTGYTLLFIGGEMVGGSWLFVSFLFFFVTSYVQGKREENNFLRSSFAMEYRSYMKKTKMLIPLIV